MPAKEALAGMTGISNDTQERRPQRSPPQWLGIALLALWLGWTIPALASLLPGHDRVADGDAAGIMDRLDDHGLLQATGAGPVLIRFAPPCACAAGTDAQLPSSAARVIDLRGQAGDPALPYALIVLDGGALRYAGPAALQTGCGQRRSRPVPIDALLDTEGAPVIVSTSCSCRGLRT